MPNLQTELDSGIQFLANNALDLAFWAVVLFLAYKLLRPWIHRVLVRFMERDARASGGLEKAEITRRVETVEDLLAKLLRTMILVAFVLVLLGVFNLWSVLTGLGLVAAALTFAGQSIILDILMGALILVEGQYFKGDTVSLNGVEGVVEEVGLRRTVVRDMRGTLHSISNGVIRQSANQTRTFGTATIELDGVPDKSVEAVIALLDGVGQAMATDPEWDPLITDAPPAYSGTVRLTGSGATLRMSGRVRPEARARVEQEMRRRIAAELAANGIKLIRPGSR